MPQIKFVNENISIEVEEGTKLINAIRKAGLKIETPCNSVGKCGKCKVKVFGELYPKTKEELKHTYEEDIRLACIAKVKGDVQIELLNESKSLKTINKGTSIEVKINSSVKKIKLLNINEKSFIPYVNTIDYKIENINVLRGIGTLERKESKEFYGITYKKNIIDIREKIDILLGVAVDIGTTGLSAYLVNMENGEILNKISALNPQTEFGADVISRITYGMNNENGIDDLSRSIRKKINSMIKELVEDKYSCDDIYSIIIAANTTMLHLFLGVIPDTIATAPYRSVFLDKLDFKADQLDIEINSEGILTILPSASSYVGADIVAGVIAIDFQNQKCPSIFIDIGTNGEIVTVFDGKMAASSTAAGPALEGMNISCGMRAEEGALDKFNIDENLDISYSTIGNVTAKGICGSGLIDIVASLVKCNIILSTGRFNKDLPEKIKGRLRDKKFYITDDVYISQKDIREVQLAKGAIVAGVNMLLKELNARIKDIEEVVIAGAFGYHINSDSIKTIGLIPKGFNGKITFVGNSSVEGARIALINKEKLKEMSKIKEKINVIELSMREDFQDNFIKSLNF
jgi:uncharacterized 2Fe-2S/4Fe-4S cluster protein (DUF4445 family)